MSLQDLAQAAADAVREHGWEATPAHDAVMAFQKAWNVDQQSQSPPDTVTEDGKWGPQTKSAAQAAGATNLPAAYFTPGTVAPKGSPSGAGVLPAPAQPASLAMQPAAFDAFFAISPRLEGYTPYMYTDSKGKVTTGVGNLIDSVEAAQALSWTHAGDGSPASADEVAHAWNAVKAAYPGVQSTASASLTDLRLSKESISKLVLSHLRADIEVLKARYANYASLPAAAQLALEFIAWAWGPGFDSVWNRIKAGLGDQFRQAIEGEDFTTAASIVREASAHEESINKGIVPRDLAIEALLVEAAAVKKLGLAFSKLFYPLPVPSAKTVAIAGGGAMLLIAAGLGIAAWMASRGHS